MAELDEKRLPTGIPGFDALIGGGFLEGSINLVSGGAGSGKTIMGLQYLWNGLNRYKQPGIYVSTEENVDSLRKDALAFGWDFSLFEEKGMFKFVYIPPYETKNLSQNLKSLIKQIKAKRIVIDSTSVLGLAMSSGFEVRKMLYEISALIREMNCTGINIAELIGLPPADMSSGIAQLTRFGVDEFISDTVILLHYSGFGGTADRMLNIIKMRRTNHKKGLFPFNITEKGVVVAKKEY